MKKSKRQKITAQPFPALATAHLQALAVEPDAHKRKAIAGDLWGLIEQFIPGIAGKLLPWVPALQGILDWLKGRFGQPAEPRQPRTPIFPRRRRR